MSIRHGFAAARCRVPWPRRISPQIEHRLFAHISMNWRGRPLTSHEVIVNTIAGTTTRTGLQVHAELDPGQYPTGARISDQQMSGLALTRHGWHGDWNYTLHPEPAAPPAATTGPPAPQPATHDLSRLYHPAITGMPAAEWDHLLSRLAAPHHAQREARLATQRGHTRRPAPGGGARARLTLADRLLATILNQRYAMPKQAISQLFGVSRANISKAVTETRMLLDLLRHPIHPAGIRLATPADLASHAAALGLDTITQTKHAC